MTFGLEYDCDGLASVDVEVQVLRDAHEPSIALRFGQGDHRNGRWVAIAEGAFVHVNDEQMLLELRFANVQMV